MTIVERIEAARRAVPAQVRPAVNVSAASRAWRDRQVAADRERIRRSMELPAPRVTATKTDPEAEYVPRGVRTVTNLLTRQRGWRWRLTRAVGPRINARSEIAEPECATLCIAAVGPDGRRIIWTWRFMPKTGDWKFEDALISGEGAATSTRAAQVVKGVQP